MGSKGWYASARGALRESQALVLLVRVPTAERMREHLARLSKGEGKFANILYMIWEPRLKALLNPLWVAERVRRRPSDFVI